MPGKGLGLGYMSPASGHEGVVWPWLLQGWELAVKLSAAWSQTSLGEVVGRVETSLPTRAQGQETQ